MNRALTAWIGRALILVVSGMTCSASPDKSGVSPQAISLPSGPGSIEGLGESFEPQLNSGTFVYRIPLKLPPVRGDATPRLALEYNSGSGNGWLGLGWRLNLPHIQRLTDRGLPSYTDADTYVEESGEELVHLTDGTYRLENEWSFTRYERTPEGGWLAHLRDGSKLWLGQSSQSRLAWGTNSGSATFCWMIERMEDPNGNRAEYHYTNHLGQLYPVEIVYGLHASETSDSFQVRFAYDDSRPDPVVDYRPRFRSETRRRLAGVTVFLGPRRIRHWQLGYQTNGPVSLLSSVTMFGDERSQTNGAAQANVDFLPPIHFGYSTINLTNGWQMGTIQLNDLLDFHGNLAEFVDVNHDGLPDIVLEQNGELYSTLNPGPNKTWALSSKIQNPPVGTGISMAKATTRFVDLRGDGRARLLVPQAEAPDGTATSFYYCDFISPTQLSAPTDFEINGQFQLNDPNVQLVDLNNDKAVDLLRIDAGNFGGVSALLNGQVDGRTNSVIFTNSPRADVSFPAGWRLADMNGDRMLDLVLLQDTDNTLVCLNSGMGRFEPPYVMSGGPSRDLMLQGSGPLLSDLDHDGLSDLIVVMNGLVMVWLNQAGQRWSAPIVIQGNQIPDFSGNTTAIRFADMNGNGSTDIVWTEAGSSVLRYLDVNPGSKAWLLTSITNTLGSTVHADYRSSVEYMAAAMGTTNAWTSVAPFPLPVVSLIVESDGLGNSYTNAFSYRNAYYDGFKKEFRGFEQATKTELGDDSQGAPTLVTRFRFDTGAAHQSLKGKPLQVETATVSGGVFYRQTNAWSPRQLALSTTTGETRVVTFAFQNHKLTQEVELGVDSDAVTLEEEFDFDDYGNQIRHADYGRVENGDRSAWDDERVLVHKYSAEFPSGTNLWLLDRLMQEERQDENGVVVARKRIFYDDESFSAGNFGVMTKGNPTLIREWISISNNVSRATLRQRYDVFGNVTDLYDPLGLPGQPERGHYRHVDFDPQIHTHPIRETIYTANPDVIAGGVSQPSLVMQAAYDLGLGVLRSSTDFNLNTTLFAFDTFGRLVTITKPYDTTNFPTAVFRYVLQQPVAIGRTVNFTQSNLRETAGQPDTYDSRTFFDGLGRKIMTRSEGDTNGVVIVKGATLFNQRRSAWRSFLPYFEAGALDFTPVNQTGPFVETHHDALGREIETSQPPTSPDNYRAFSRTIYGPLTRLLQDEEQTKTNSPHFGAGMRYTEDGLRDKSQGRLRRVEEIVKLTDDGLAAANTNVWLTQYRYDLLDNFLGYTDSQGNQKEFRYDALSRKTFMNDPDRGVMTYAYDDASNLRSTLDAKSQTIAYAYDGVNRLLIEHYRPTNQTPDVTYHYDAPYPNVSIGDGTTATANNAKGMLAWVQDLSGEEHTSYDVRGRVEFVVKRIPDPQFLSRITNHASLVSYRTAFAYDSLDRVTTLTYADNDQVSYVYNARNLLSRITGGTSGSIISNIVYQASDQLRQIDYGNGVRTTYDYDPRLRLNSLLTVSQPSTLNSRLINFSYDFDGVSNIKSITDNRPVSAVPAGDARRNTQVFQYDDLYRITRATYNPSTLNSQLSTNFITYRYDRIGNMLAQHSDIAHFEKGVSVTELGNMSYGAAGGRIGRVGRAPADPPGPHALTSVSQLPTNNPQPRIFPYDANGSMTAIDGLTNTWDFKDRLITVEDATMRAVYTYDYTDRRVLKRVWSKTTTNSLSTINPQPSTVLYPDKYFEVRAHDAPTKYVWSGNTRVARVTGSLNTNQRVQRLRLWPGWNLVSLAVTATNSLSQLSAFSFQLSAFRWDQPTLTWLPVATNETLAAATVLWLRASTNATATVAGTYTPPLNTSVPTGPSFQPGAGLEVLTLLGESAGVRPDVSLWKFDGPSQTWLIRYGTSLPSQPDFPMMLAAGEGFVARAEASTTLEVPETALRIRYYHQDHLGSSAVVSDAVGGVVEETAFYAFGQQRKRLLPRATTDAYQFSQKEMDPESNLVRTDGRYLSSQLCRFIKVDPAANKSALDSAMSAQSLNTYSYSLNRPGIYVDPSGEIPILAPILFGAVLEAGIEAWTQVATGRFNSGRLGSALVKGAMTGGAGHVARGLTLIGRAVAGATSSLVGGSFQRYLNNEDPLGKWNCATDLGIGAAASFAQGLMKAQTRKLFEGAFGEVDYRTRLGHAVKGLAEDLGNAAKYAIKLAPKLIGAEMSDSQRQSSSSGQSFIAPGGGSALPTTGNGRQVLDFQGVELNGSAQGFNGYSRNMDTGEIRSFSGAPPPGGD